jgi:2-succinyl-6-hydroxy-2,4-cyclohexadiene-1-carboxylate synthase
MLKYTVSGSSTHPPLLFLHGFLGVKEDWEEVISHLKDTFQCYAFDLPGHGESAFHPHLLEALCSTFLSLKLHCAPIVGYSMGGRLSLFLKQHFPNYFQQLILLGVHTGLKTNAEKNMRWLQDLNWCETLETQPFETFLKNWYDQPLFHSLKKKPELYAKILKRRSLQNPRHMAEILRSFSLAWQPALEFSKGTLFLHGEEDLSFDALYRTLPSHVTVKKIANCGHLLHLENPKAVAETIKHFFEVDHVARNQNL